MVDKSGAFAETIDQNPIEWDHQRSVLQALGQYVQQNLRAGQKVAMSTCGPNQAAVDAFIAAGGKDAYLAQAPAGAARKRA